MIDKTLDVGKLDAKVGKGRSAVVILRTTVDAALNLCETEMNFERCSYFMMEKTNSISKYKMSKN